MSRTLNITQLRAACGEQRDLFRKVFGTSVEVTEARAIEHAASFNWPWAAADLLSTPAQAKYDKAHAAAQAKYDKVCAPAGAKYDKARAAAQAKYDKVCAAARAEYSNMRAAAWARAYIADGVA